MDKEENGSDGGSENRRSAIGGDNRSEKFEANTERGGKSNRSIDTAAVDEDGERSDVVGRERKPAEIDRDSKPEEPISSSSSKFGLFADGTPKSQRTSDNHACYCGECVGSLKSVDKRSEFCCMSRHLLDGFVDECYTKSADYRRILNKATSCDTLSHSRNFSYKKIADRLKEYPVYFEEKRTKIGNSTIWPIPHCVLDAVRRRFFEERNVGFGNFSKRWQPKPVSDRHSPKLIKKSIYKESNNDDDREPKAKTMRRDHSSGCCCEDCYSDQPGPPLRPKKRAPRNL